MASMQLIHDTTIVTADERGSILYDAAIAVRDGRIAELGPSSELAARYPDAERVYGRGRAVFPGFANTHTHLSRVLARGIYEDLSPSHTPPFTGGLAPLPLPALSSDEERVMALLGAVEAIRSGTTLVLEESAGLDGYAGALADTGLRLVLCERAWDRANASIGQPGAFQLDSKLAQSGLERIKAFHARWDGKADGRLRAGLAAWAPDMCSPDLLDRLRKLQTELGALATVHLNQIWGEVAAVKEQRGVLPTEYLGQAGPALESPGGRPLPLHDRRGRADPGRLGRRRGRELGDRRAPRPRGPHRRARARGLSDHAGHRQHGRGHGRGRADGALHGAREAPGRAPAHAGRSAGLGDPQRLSRARRPRRRLAGARQPRRPDPGRPAKSPT
jgi:hypothetical protein